MKKIEFDELQQSRRYRYGYQSFILLAFLILADTAISGMGIVWIAPPTNTFLLLLAGCTYFICRCIWGDALVGPKENPKRLTTKAAGMIILAAAVAVLAAGFALSRVHIQPSADTGGDILSFACLTMWAIIALVYALKHLVRGKSEQ
nr:hypothetical protein [uncultured Caproiciproducens sp.]